MKVAMRCARWLVPVSFLVTSLMLVPGSAFSGRNENGAMVLHHVPLTYHFVYPYCSEYPLPDSCSQLVTRVDTTSPTIIWLAAAFPQNANPGVLAFQVGIYGDVTSDYFVDRSACGPAGWFEIPDVGWPGTGTGTAVAYTRAIYSRLFKMYWFAIDYPGPGFSLSTGNYPHGDLHAEWVDDSSPPQVDFCDRFGTVRWGADGGDDCPGGEGLPTGACCRVGESCTVETQTDCAGSGGQYRGDGVPCDPDPCGPVGACCHPDATCSVMFQSECDLYGWQFHPGETCEPTNPCAPYGACCFDTGACVVMDLGACASVGGVPGGTPTCDPNPCVVRACCLQNGHCEMRNPTHCRDLGGIIQDPGVTCDQIPCPVPIACCFPDGHCEVMPYDECVAEGGIPMDQYSSCESVVCAPTPTQRTTWGHIRQGFR